MSQQFPPDQQVQFGGVITSGHPLRRPKASAARCQNFRVMPGNWLRLRSGRTKYYTGVANGSFQRFHEFRKSGGGTYNLCQRVNGTDAKSYWSKLDLTTTPYTLTNLEEITVTTDGWPGPPGWAAVCSMRNRVIWGNGLGERNGGVSKPPLSSWDGTTVRYVGLDAFVQSTGPTATFTAGSGQVAIQYFRTFYVGLYNTTTGHYSNGVRCGTYTAASPPPANGTIGYANLGNLAYTSHNATEAAELKYVFYVTNDGGAVPYLVIQADGSGPTTVATGSTTATIGGSDFTLDLTQEMPTQNFPPRPMTKITYANGRVYGALLSGGGVGSPYRDFSYVVPSRFVAAVVWSAAADDITNRAFVGVPEESFPLLNLKYTPNGEDPIIVATAQDDNRVIVVTRTGTFLLEEYSDGLHQWRTISWVDGALNEQSFVRTPYGSCWITQNNDLVMLQSGHMTLAHISNDYSALLNSVSNATAPADYLRDTTHQIDRYQIYIGGDASVIHDFWLEGKAYTETNQTVGAAKTMYDSSNNRHHIISVAENLYTHEADPHTGNLPTTDDGTEITGTYIEQWNPADDAGIRKEYSTIEVIGDGSPSAQLANASPLTVSWFGDLSNAEQSTSLVKTPQSTTDRRFRAKMASAYKFWMKLKFVLAGHSTEGNYNSTPATDGDINPNSYGSVLQVDTALNQQSGNRS